MDDAFVFLLLLLTANIAWVMTMVAKIKTVKTNLLLEGFSINEGEIEGSTSLIQSYLLVGNMSKIDIPQT